MIATDYRTQADGSPCTKQSITYSVLLKSRTLVDCGRLYSDIETVYIRSILAIRPISFISRLTPRGRWASAQEVPPPHKSAASAGSLEARRVAPVACHFSTFPFPSFLNSSCLSFFGHCADKFYLLRFKAWSVHKIDVQLPHDFTSPISRQWPTPSASPPTPPRRSPLSLFARFNSNQLHCTVHTDCTVGATIELGHVDRCQEYERREVLRLTASLRLQALG